MKKHKGLIGLGVCILGSVTSVYAANPASKDYVDQQIQNLQTQINNIQAGPTYVPGQQAQGGTIIYVDSTGKHGLAAANSDQSGGDTWFGSTSITGASNDVSNPANFDAAGQVYTDWHLPTGSELTLMCTNKGLFPGHDGPASGAYWTSTENSTTNAWFINFSSCFPSSGSKTFSLGVRAIRAF